MCTYIMTVLPAGTDLEPAREDYKMFGLNFWVQKERPPAISTHDAYVGTAGFCDCGAALGSSNVSHRPIKPPDEQLPKLKKRGWSEAKIERWLDEKRTHLAGDIRRADERTVRELARWHAFIEHALESRLASQIGVFVHSYNKGFGADIIRNIVRVPLRMLSPELLRNIADDTLYEFVPDRVRA
jgi:hypothetical protein